VPSAPDTTAYRPSARGVEEDAAAVRRDADQVGRAEALVDLGPLARRPVLDVDVGRVVLGGGADAVRDPLAVAAHRGAVLVALLGR
jgi:hypothetical protein